MCVLPPSGVTMMEAVRTFETSVYFYDAAVVCSAEVMQRTTICVCVAEGSEVSLPCAGLSVHTEADAR
jgi:hypothetical protein